MPKILKGEGEWKVLIDSKGNVELWGRDFWSHNPLAEIILFIGWALLLAPVLFCIWLVVMIALFGQ